MSNEVSPKGFVGLAQAIDSLRTELYSAMVTSSRRDMRFRVPSVELSLEVAVTHSTTASGGVSWWVVEAEAGHTRESVATQSLKLQLEPIFLDSNGVEVDALISGRRNAGGRSSEQIPEGGRR